MPRSPGGVSRVAHEACPAPPLYDQLNTPVGRRVVAPLKPPGMHILPTPANAIPRSSIKPKRGRDCARNGGRSCERFDMHIR
jgi:hypothetical protein